MGTHFRAAFDKEGIVAKISGPSSLKSRYITEDLPYGLVPIKKLANQYNIPTPMIDAVIEFASVVNETNYMTEGLSLEELGIARLDRDELRQLLDEGFE
jgi:opine dehydrogenase